jgi:hypothetical protein
LLSQLWKFTNYSTGYDHAKKNKIWTMAHYSAIYKNRSYTIIRFKNETWT